MRLAASDRERLWIGLEGFVNCSDSLDAYQYLSSNFSSFWPAEIWNLRPKQRLADQPSSDQEKRLERKRIDETGNERKWGEVHFDIDQVDFEPESLNWHLACHKLFLFYRDMLRAVWSEEDAGQWPDGEREEFLLGLTQLNQDTCRKCKDSKKGELQYLLMPGLFGPWEEIVKQFPNVNVAGPVQIKMLWKLGDFFLLTVNDFQSAFYTLFRQNWRARVCRRCNAFFVARKPKQIFCGTACSAGNRLASKRKWWNRVGVKLRAKQMQKSSKRSSRDRRSP
jgi:hypothetical protein